MYEQVGDGVADGSSYMLAAARSHGVSWPVSHTELIAHDTPALQAELPAAAVFGIDETHQGKPI